MVKTVFVLGMLLIFLTGCGAKTPAQYEQQEGVVPPKWPVSEHVSDDIDYVIDEYDPWEGFNRRMYVFNYYFDTYIFLPVVSGYAYITPDFIEDRVTDFFKNLGELKNFTNNLLQLKADAAITTLARFVFNSTAGVAGLWDPATSVGLERQPEDFGQTLGHYNVGPGPYLVLPVFGPSTLRDTTGLIVDTAVKTLVYDELTENASNDTEIKMALNLLEGIDTRHRTPFRYYQSGSPFEYNMIRLLYLEKRKLDIAK